MLRDIPKPPSSGLGVRFKRGPVHEGFEFSYYVSLAVLTIIIVCTFVATFVFLSSEAGDTPKVRRFSKMISEKSANTGGGDEAVGKEVVSYSRVAGVLGAMSLTGLFICVVFWVQYALFNDKSLDPLSELWPLFTVGCALFAPYAFNRVSQIGK